MKVVGIALGLVVGATRLCSGESGIVPCDPETVGVDISHWRGLSIAAILGRAVGQTFTATDSVISSITVWRWPGEDTVVVRMKLWITGTYDDGFPNLNNMILSGPALVVFGDGVHPVKIQYILDPPLALPGPGKYTFYIQPECAFLYFDLLSVQTDDYGGGRAYLTGRSLTCSLGPADSSESPKDDLIFDIEFCRDASTPTRRTSWGEMKVIYR